MCVYVCMCVCVCVCVCVLNDLFIVFSGGMESTYCHWGIEVQTSKILP